MRKKRIYALYRGDKWITDGTREELAKYLNVKVKTIDFYTTPVWRKRTNNNAYIVIKLED